MKKEYQKPLIEIIELSDCDVIVTSIFDPQAGENDIDEDDW